MESDSAMAEELNKGTEVELANGEKVYVKPLTIKQLRRFMKVASDLVLDGTLDDDQINKMVDAAQIALEKAAPALAADRDALEDALDMRSFNIILSIAVGADPNE